MEKTISKKTKIIYFVIALVMISALTFLSRFISLVSAFWLRAALQWGANLLMGAVAFMFIKKSHLKEDYGLRNPRSYIIGFVIAIVLQLLIGVLPALIGQSLVGTHTDFVLWNLIYQFFYFVLLIGPMEELIFRVYVQGTLIELLPKCKWLGVVAASLLFGFWHIINGNLIQVLFTSVIGCAFGFSKYLIKSCKYSGVAFAHGLYDFLNVVTTILFVK